ncbi:MAG TPA: antitoxin [Flavobacterium sp.]|nr:antitoxin [Flavobacterium sp.]
MEYIEINPKIMLGKPVIKGTRIAVEHIISLLAQGISIDEILQDYKGLTKLEILACLQYAENILEKIE